jgi:hypothetical protein
MHGRALETRNCVVHLSIFLILLFQKFYNICYIVIFMQLVQGLDSQCDHWHPTFIFDKYILIHLIALMVDFTQKLAF